MDQRKAMLAGLVNTFDGAWKNLERAHKVDALGGMQYSRILGEWMRQGAPHRVTAFILDNRMDEAPVPPAPHAVPVAKVEPPPLGVPAAQERHQKRRPPSGPEGGDRP